MKTKIEKQTRATLKAFGIYPKVLGHHYFVLGVLLAQGKQEPLYMKEIYLDIGKHRSPNATYSGVERAMRAAVRSAWEKGNQEMWQKYFPPAPDGTRKRPTNSEFLTCLLEIVEECEQ